METKKTAKINWLSADEVAARLGVPLKTLYRWLMEGRIEHRKYPKLIRISETAVEKFEHQHTVKHV